MTCIFMGYDEERKGFKLMDINHPRKFFSERSVVFDENRFPAKERKLKNQGIRIGTQGECSHYVPNYMEALIPALPNVTNVGPCPNHGDGTNSRSRQNVDSCSNLGNGTNGQVDSCSYQRNGTNGQVDSCPSFGNGINGRPESAHSSDTYSSTELSRFSHDQQSSSSQSDSTIIDVENLSTISSVDELRNISKRTRVPKQFPDFVMTDRKIYSASKPSVSDINPHISVPNTAGEALQTPESSLWLEAMLDELRSFNDCQAWTLVVPQGNRKIVGNKWVFKTKTDPDGNVIYRARLCAKGFTQTYGVDYFDTFSPVVKRSTLRMLFSIAVNFSLKVDHLDVKTAFLNGDLFETVYMSQPEGFTAEGFEGHVCKLNKAVYGLKQAARSWNLKADKVLKGEGFVNFLDEPCVYIKRGDSSLIIVALYVDDFFLFYINNWDKSALLKVLQSHFKIKDLGEAQTCLGMRIERNWSEGTLLLHQEDYISSVLQKFKMQDCKGVKTPLEYNLKLKDLKGGPKGEEPYQELIGCLLYLSVCTRPDISFTVSFLSQFNNSHTKVHWNLAKRLLAYLKATPRTGLNYTRSPKPSYCLIGYADADWAGNPSDYKSYSGYCFTLDNNLISWESKKQKLAAQSSTESEYIAVTEAVKESMYLNNFINDLFQCGLQQVTIFNDNMSALKLAYSSGFSARTKHFGCRMQLVRDAVQDGEVALEHMSTNVMPADVLTKPLGIQKHVNCCINLRLY